MSRKHDPLRELPVWMDEDRRDLQAVVDRFVRTELTSDYVRECDRECRPPLDRYRKLAESGWLSVTVPEEYGGHGGSYVDLAIILETLSRGMLTLALLVFRSAVHGSHAILTHGTEEQRRSLLPRICNGEVIVAFALTEPDAGSDAASVQTRAERDGDDFVINGTKMFTTGFHVSKYVLVAARTGTPDSRSRGLTVFVVPTDAEGLTGTIIETLGHRPVQTNELRFVDVRVPSSAVLGEVNEGWSVLTQHLAVERLSAATCAAGAAAAVVELASDHARSRVQFGRAIGDFQAVQHMLADMAVAVSTARSLVYDVAERLDRGYDMVSAAAIAKLHCTESYKLVADLGVQIFGGYGYTSDSDVLRHYRDCRVMTIGGGTSQIQRNIIGKAVIEGSARRSPA